MAILNPPHHFSFERRKDQPLVLQSFASVVSSTQIGRAAKWFKLHPQPTFIHHLLSAASLEVELDAFRSQLTILTAGSSAIAWGSHRQDRRYVTFFCINLRLWRIVFEKYLSLWFATYVPLSTFFICIVAHLFEYSQMWYLQMRWSSFMFDWFCVSKVWLFDWYHASVSYCASM